MGAYGEGYNGYFLGTPQTACPYESGADRMDWLDGWLDAKSDARVQALGTQD